MAIRVLATFPELPAHSERVHGQQPVTASPGPAVGRVSLGPRAAAAKTSRRGRTRASFPGISIAALTILSAAIWSLVAFREVRRQGDTPTEPRIAAESAESAAPETTLR